MQCLLNSALLEPLTFHTIMFIIKLVWVGDGSFTIFFLLSLRFRDVYGRFTLTINVKGFIEVLNIPPVSTLGSLISIVNLVKFHGSRIIHISLTNSANLKVIGLSRVVTSVTRTFMVAKIDCIYGLLALNIFIVFYLSQVSGVRAIGWVTSTREDIFSSYRRFGPFIKSWGF